MTIVLETYLLALTSAFYLLRGMLEFPTLGWRAEVKLTVVIGVIVLPLLTGVAASSWSWASLTILCASFVGLLVNAVLLVRLWSGVNPVSILTMMIVAAYAAIVALAA